METMTEMLERMLTPELGANLEAGKATLLQGVERERAHLTEVRELLKPVLEDPRNQRPMRLQLRSLWQF